MVVSGVRSSWETLETKSSLAVSRVRSEDWILDSTASARPCASARALSDSTTERSSRGPAGLARRVGSLAIWCTTRSSSTIGSETSRSIRARARVTANQARRASSATAPTVARSRQEASELAWRTRSPNAAAVARCDSSTSAKSTWPVR